MAARGELAKMGVEGASLKPHRGTDVSRQHEVWVLDASGFRRSDPDGAGGAREQELSELALLAAGLALVSIPLLWWPWRVWLRGLLALTAVVLIALGIAALRNISESVGGLHGRVFALAGIVVGVALLFRAAFALAPMRMLLSNIPATIRSTCEPAPRLAFPGAGWRAAVYCQADGLDHLDFSLYESEETMNEAYNDHRPSYLEDHPVGTDCGSPLAFRYAGPRAAAEQAYVVDREERGMLFCEGGTFPSIAWTDNANLVLGYAQGGPLTGLYQWWQDFQTGRIK